MKPVAIGRRNWMFVGSVQAGGRAAVLMTLMANCKATMVEPWDWLKVVLIQLPMGASLESLLPNTWLELHPHHRWNIADRRKLEREKNNLRFTGRLRRISKSKCTARPTNCLTLQYLVRRGDADRHRTATLTTRQPPHNG